MERATPDGKQRPAGAGDEPALTENNSETVLAEDDLVDDDRDGRSGDEEPITSTGTPGDTDPRGSRA